LLYVRSIYSVSVNNGADLVCFGIENFTAFNDSTIDPLTMYVYDSVKMLETEIDFLIQLRNKALNESISRVFSNMIINDEIHIPPLTTGDIYFDPGISDLDYLFKGDRNTGHIFDILNFNAGYDDFVFVGLWNKEGLIFCGSSNELSMSSFALNQCHDPVFRGATFPSDAPPPIIVPLSSSLKSFLIAISAISITASFVSFILVIVFRNRKVIRNAQPLSMLLIAFGCILGGLVIALSSIEPSIPVCSALNWFYSLAFVFVFSTILLKMQRIDKIVNNHSLKRIKVTNIGLLQSVSVNVIIISILCMLTDIFGSQKDIYESSEMHNQVYLKGKCSIEGIAVFSYLNLAYNIGIAAACAIYLWKIRDVPASVNETDSIIKVFSSSILIIIATIILIEFVGFDPVYDRLVVGLSFFLLIQVSLNSLLIPKFIVIFQEFRKSQVIVDAKYVKGTKTLESVGEDEDAYHKALEEIGQVDTIEEKIKLCYHNINLWKLVIVKVFDDQDDSTTKKNSATASGKGESKIKSGIESENLAGSRHSGVPNSNNDVVQDSNLII